MASLGPSAPASPALAGGHGARWPGPAARLLKAVWGQSTRGGSSSSRPFSGRKIFLRNSPKSRDLCTAQNN